MYEKAIYDKYGFIICFIKIFQLFVLGLFNLQEFND